MCMVRVDVAAAEVCNWGVLHVCVAVFATAAAAAATAAVAAKAGAMVLGQK